MEGEGLGFRPVRPDLTLISHSPETMRKIYHPRKGGEYLIRKIFLPPIEQTFEDTLAACGDADLIIGHVIQFSVPTVAEVLKKPWVSPALQPCVLFSRYDPPILPGAPDFLRHARGWGPRFWSHLYRLVKWKARPWGAAINTIRRRLGIAALRNPLLDDMYSPYGTHGWFSKVLGAPPDGPAKFQITGFPFYDKLEPGQGLSPQLEEFLRAGEPPVVFTLGSSAVFDAGDFYRESIQAVKKLGCRAVLLVGGDPRNQQVEKLPDNIFVAEYAPYSTLFPRVAAVVHQGGVGTTGQALRSGRPMLVVPYSFDQPDNAMRVVRLGSGRSLARGNYRAQAVSAELRLLLNEPEYSKRASEVAEVVRGEDGIARACEALEEVLKT